MKKLRLICLPLIVSLWAGCNKETGMERPVPGEGTAQVSFALSTNTSASRGPSDHDGISPLAKEKEVYNYMVLIFDAGGDLEASLYRKPYDPSNGQNNPLDGNSALTFLDQFGISEKLTLEAGDKRIFALVNAPEELWDKLMNDFIVTRKNVDDCINFTWIFNGLASIANPSPDPVQGERGFMMTTLGGFQEQKLKAGDIITINLPVGRAVAKVSVASDLTDPVDPAEQPHGALSDIEYTVVNQPKNMNIVAPIGNGGFTYPPYFNEDTPLSQNYFDRVDELDGYPEKWQNMSRSGAITRVYCMENGNQLPGELNATRVLIRGKYEPETLLDENGANPSTNNNPNSDGTFWRKREIVDGSWGDFVDGYYYENPNLNSGEAAVKYVEGICFYFVDLDHEETTALPFPHNYTVHRNSYYNIDITKVSHAGLEDPTSPPPPTIGDLTVSITIEDWDYIHKEAEL